MPVDFTPKGSDGANAFDGTPMSAVKPNNLRAATAAFRDIALAVDSQDRDAAESIWADMVERIDDEVNPHGLLIVVGVMFNAWIIRTQAGDPDPNGKPTAPIRANLLAVDKETGEQVSLPMEELALKAVNHAANWEWEELNEFLNSHVDGNDDSGHFLHELAVSLVGLFIGVGGIETAGWRT